MMSGHDQGAAAMTRRIAALSTCLALAAGGLAACGGDDDDGGATAPATAPPANEPGAGSQDVVVVDMKDIQYVPRHVTVRRNQTVRWTNSDPVAHTVTARRGSDMDSGIVNPGEQFETQFRSTGRVDYYCTIHPRQTGSVTVR